MAGLRPALQAEFITAALQASDADNDLSPTNRRTFADYRDTGDCVSPCVLIEVGVEEHDAHVLPYLRTYLRILKFKCNRLLVTLFAQH